MSSRAKNVGLVSNISLVLVAGSSWLAHSFPNAVLPITLVTGVGVAVACYLTFKVALPKLGDSETDLHSLDSQNSDDAVFPAMHHLRKSAEVKDGVYLRSKFGRDIKFQDAHHEKYWAMIENIALDRGRTRGGAAGKSMYDITLNKIDVFVSGGDQGGGKTECFIVEDENGIFGGARIAAKDSQ